jgi:hypothetical protein
MSSRANPDRDDEDRELAEDIEPGLDLAVLRRRREVLLLVVAAVAILGLSIFAAVRLLRTPRPSTAELSTLTRDAVRERFPYGHVLQFSATEEMTFHQTSDSAYEVKGRVVAISQDGQTHVSYVFTCSLELTQYDGWRAGRVSLTPLY